MEGGLVVPVVRNAAALNVTKIAEVIRDLSGKASAVSRQAIRPADGHRHQPGWYGVDAFTPVLNRRRRWFLGSAGFSSARSWKTVRSSSGRHRC